MRAGGSGVRVVAPITEGMSAKEVRERAHQIKVIGAKNSTTAFFRAVSKARAKEIDDKITEAADQSLEEVIEAVRFGGKYYVTAKDDARVVAAFVRLRLAADLETLPGARNGKEHGSQVHLANQLDGVADGHFDGDFLVLLEASRNSALELATSTARAQAREAARSPVRQRFELANRHLSELDTIAGSSDWFDLDDARRCVKSYDRWVDLPDDIQIHHSTSITNALAEMRLRLREG